jgi:undecaprenyl-diphosphatase
MAPEGYIWDLDREWLLALNGSWGAGWDNFWWLVSQGWFWTPLYVAFIGVMWWRFGWKKMLIGLALVVLGLALADQTANFFKTFTPKFRPSHTVILWEGVPFNEWVHTVRGYVGGEFGTVSGHAATSTAIALTGAGICRRWWLWIFAVLYVVLTCYSRIYLGLHFPLDITFGVTAGTIIALAMLLIWRAVNLRWGYKLAPKRQRAY